MEWADIDLVIWSTSERLRAIGCSNTKNFIDFYVEKMLESMWKYIDVHAVSIIDQRVWNLVGIRCSVCFEGQLSPS